MLKFNKSILKLLGVLIILSSIFPTGMGVFLYLQSRSFLAKSVKTTASVSELQQRGDVYYPVFSFVDKNGKEHGVKSNSGSYPAAYSKGDSVPMLYNPENPKQARTDSFAALWFFPTFCVVMGIVPVIIGTVFVFIGRRKIREI